MTKRRSNFVKQLILENEELKSRLSEAEETLNAIRSGEVDAIVVSGSGTEKVFSLTSAETPYRLLVEEMKEGAVTLSEDGIILYCNHSFEELVSISMEQIVGRNFSQFLNKDEMHNYYKLLHENPLERISDDIVYFTCNDVRKYLHLSYCPIPKGVLGKICIIISDVTELKKYQNELQQLVNERTSELELANRQLKETNTTKDKLFSIIAHDLRAPFTVLLGFSELLGRNAQNYDTGHFEVIVSNIQSAARSAFELLENLFLWATAQKKQLNYNPETTDLTEILQELTRNARTIAVTKNISVNCIPAEKLMVFADVNMLKVILHNLINNAIKFTYPGGQIEIRASLGKKSVEISISDNGMGMSKEKIRHLFNIEANKTSSGTANEKGTGLGLLICKEFIEMHKGNLLIQSKVGKGSTFTVVFPQPEVVNKKTGVKTPLQKHQKRRQVG